MNPESMNKTTGERRDGEKKPLLCFRSSTPQHAAEAGDGRSRQAPGRRTALWLTTEGAVQSEKFLMGKGINNKVWFAWLCGVPPRTPLCRNPEQRVDLHCLRGRRGINLQLWLNLQQQLNLQLCNYVVNDHLFVCFCSSPLLPIICCRNFTSLVRD